MVFLEPKVITNYFNQTIISINIKLTIFYSSHHCSLKIKIFTNGFIYDKFIEKMRPQPS